MSRTAKRGTLLKSTDLQPQGKQLAFLANAALEQLHTAKEQLAASQTYLAAVLFEYGAAEDGILISKGTMEALQGQSFGIEKASDKDGISLRVVLAPVVEAEVVEAR